MDACARLYILTRQVPSRSQRLPHADWTLRYASNRSIKHCLKDQSTTTPEPMSRRQDWEDAIACIAIPQRGRREANGVSVRSRSAGKKQIRVSNLNGVTMRCQDRKLRGRRGKVAKSPRTGPAEPRLRPESIRDSTHKDAHPHVGVILVLISSRRRDFQFQSQRTIPSSPASPVSCVSNDCDQPAPAVESRISPLLERPA
jgi:hypothetical protein